MALVLTAVGANAQLADNARLLSEIETVYKAAKRPFDLHANNGFKEKVRQVIKAADENTVKLLNEFPVFVYMNNMMPDVAEAIGTMSPSFSSRME